MQNRSYSYPLSGFTEFYDAISQSSIINEVSNITRFGSVSSGSLVQGDFKSPNPWSYDVSDFSLPVTDITYNYADGSFLRQPTANSFLEVGEWDTSILASTDEVALERLYSAVRGDLDVSVDAFQARQTARMFSACKQAEDFLSSWSRRRFRSIRSVSSLYLQFVYGWKPLIGTIYGIADESCRYVANRISRFRVGKTSVLPRKEVGSSFKWCGPFDYEFEGTLLYSRRYQCSFNTPDGFDLARWASLNPASILWETLPYSFCVDWVYNVGGFLRQYESAVLYADRFANGFTSTLLVKKGKTTERVNSPQCVGTTSGDYRTIEFRRYVLGATPFPKPPRFEVQMGSTRLLNLAALLAQKLG